MAAWPWVIQEEVGGAPVAFLHHALGVTGRGFAEPVADPDPAALDRLFSPRHARLVFYDHVHHSTSIPAEVVGHARYVNPSALGCSPEPLARYALLDVDSVGSCQLAFRAVTYDPAPLFAAFREREVPERRLRRKGERDEDTGIMVRQPTASRAGQT